MNRRHRRCIIQPSIGKGGTKTYPSDVIRPPVKTGGLEAIKPDTGYRLSKTLKYILKDMMTYI